MATIDPDRWMLLSETYGFIGNSLLKPMNQTPTIGLDPAFWESFPSAFSDAQVEAGLKKLSAYASAAEAMELEKAVERAAVEYTHLFIGPPSPVAPPWETMNGPAEVTVGFGSATFAMRDALREAGLELSNENNQYEDHIGIELLYLSEMCRRIAVGEPNASSESDIVRFIEERPLSWIATLRGRVEAECPCGYYAGLLELAEGVLLWQRGALAA